MAATARGFMANFDKRCAGLNNGTIRALPSQKSSEKSLADLLSAAGNWYEGLNNSLVNRYARSSDPLAKEVVAAWSKAMLAKTDDLAVGQSLSVTAAPPVLVTRSVVKPNGGLLTDGDYRYFPQTLQRVGTAADSPLLLSMQVVKDSLHDGGDLGRDWTSTSGGSSWREVEQPLAPWLVKPCITRADSVLCFSYYLRRASQHSNRTALLRGQVFEADAKGSLRQTAVMNATLNFPAAHGLLPMPVGELNETTGTNFGMVTDGGVVDLRDGGHMMTLYGNRRTVRATPVATVPRSSPSRPWTVAKTGSG